MKIVFNVHGVGLANNGGSRTIVKTSEILSDLGNEVIIASNHNNKYTWHDFSKKVNFVKSDHMVEGDVIVATGYGSVKSTLRSNIKSKFYYIRGYENWVASDADLLRSYRSLNCIVNSEWLLSFLRKKRIKSTLIYPGIDNDVFFDKLKDRDIELGGLYHRKHKTKRHDDISKVANKLNIKCALLGLDRKDPSVEELNDFYNSVKVWMAPTELEGLHNCPIEASLSGCAIVYNNHERNGMHDYCKNNKTALVYKSRDIDSACDAVDKLLKDPELSSLLNGNMKELLLRKIGTRKANGEKFLNLLKGSYGF